VKKDYADFYRSSMLYLAFISSDSLGYDFKLPLAVDVSLAALLGEGIYNFAQLLMHPIVKVRTAVALQCIAPAARQSQCSC
jgi:26S proteasome regulatory subunit N9